MILHYTTRATPYSMGGVEHFTEVVWVSRKENLVRYMRTHEGCTDEISLAAVEDLEVITEAGTKMWELT